LKHEGTEGAEDFVKKNENKLSEGAFEAALDAMTVYSEKIPVLPLDAFRRDEIYRDHN